MKVILLAVAAATIAFVAEASQPPAAELRPSIGTRCEVPPCAGDPIAPIVAASESVAVQCECPPCATDEL